MLSLASFKYLLNPRQADHLPKHCQRLQSLVQTKPVGKAATFHKVDSLVRATRHVHVRALDDHWLRE